MILPTTTTSPGSIAVNSRRGSKAVACRRAIPTPPSINNGERTTIAHQLSGTSSRRIATPAETTRLARTSATASGSATVPVTIPTARSSAHRSRRTGGRKSSPRLYPRARPAASDRCKRLYLLQRLGAYTRHFLQIIYGPKLTFVVAVLDDLLGGRGTNLGQFFELFGIGRVDVHEEGRLCFGLGLFEGDAVDDFRGGFRSAGGIVRSS